MATNVMWEINMHYEHIAFSGIRNKLPVPEPDRDALGDHHRPKRHEL
jgi:hypothetical protein